MNVDKEISQLSTKAILGLYQVCTNSVPIDLNIPCQTSPRSSGQEVWVSGYNDREHLSKCAF